MTQSRDPTKATGIINAMNTPGMVRQTNALADAMKSLEALRMPQINALTRAAKQVGAFRAPQINALAAFAHPLAAETPRLVSSGAPASTPTPPSQISKRRSVASATDLGLFVRERRLAMALTQQELADAAGTGRRFISELETGKSTLEIGKVIQVCRYLGLDLFAAAR